MINQYERCSTQRIESMLSAAETVIGFHIKAAMLAMEHEMRDEAERHSGIVAEQEAESELMRDALAARGYQPK